VAAGGEDPLLPVPAPLLPEAAVPVPVIVGRGCGWPPWSAPVASLHAQKPSARRARS